MTLALTHTLAWAAFFAGLTGIVAVAERLQRGSWQSPPSRGPIPAFAGTNREDDTMPDDIFVQQILPLQVKAHPDLIAELQRIAHSIAANGAEITSDDIHERVSIPKGVDRRVMAAAFMPKKDWELVGYQKSRRADCHYRTIARWRLQTAIRREAAE